MPHPKTATPRRSTDAVLRKLRAFGLAYPGAHLKSPWPGHLDLAVKDKTFAYLSGEGEPFRIGCKLPRTHAVALLLPFCAPTPYGLGKSGWVTATPAPAELDVDMFEQWIDESYRAQAPKTLVKQLDAGATAATAPRKPAAPRARAKPAAKRTRAKPAAARRR